MLSMVSNFGQILARCALDGPLQVKSITIMYILISDPTRKQNYSSYLKSKITRENNWKAIFRKRFPKRVIHTDTALLIIVAEALLMIFSLVMTTLQINHGVIRICMVKKSIAIRFYLLVSQHA